MRKVTVIEREAWVACWCEGWGGTERFGSMELGRRGKKREEWRCEEKKVSYI